MLRTKQIDAVLRVDLGFVGTELMKKLAFAKKISDKQALEMRAECKQFILTLIKHIKLKNSIGVPTC